MDEYKETGIFAGAAFSALGIGPVKWFVLALAVIAVFQVAVKTEELRTLRRIKTKEKERANNHKGKVEGQHSNVVPTSPPAPIPTPTLPTENSVIENQENKIGSYYSSAMGIPVFPTENTVEANHRALKEYFLPRIQNQEEKAEKLAEVTINIASFELSDPDEILEALIEDSGLSNEEIFDCFPKLKSRGE